jgi:hypothetical protein
VRDLSPSGAPEPGVAGDGRNFFAALRSLFVRRALYLICFTSKQQLPDQHGHAIFND